MGTDLWYVKYQMQGRPTEELADLLIGCEPDTVFYACLAEDDIDDLKELKDPIAQKLIRLIRRNGGITVCLMFGVWLRSPAPRAGLFPPVRACPEKPLG